ncbi:MAG: AtpZ/AtpI family protein [Ichthyobacteriaceae bacterium]|nr:AtpZ/AtpI family protein [Ichthyobacteriaceae bacterium]
MKQQNKKEKKSLNKILKLSGVGVQMGLVIYVLSLLGKKLDLYFKTNSNTYTLILVIVGVVVSTYGLIIQLKKIDEDESDGKK